MTPRSTGRPVAYLRKSRVTAEESGEVSYAEQEAAVRAMVGDDGANLLILSDWGVSGRKSGKDRPNYAELLRMIEAGEVSIVYSFNMSRLSRSLADLLALLELCEAHGVPVQTAKNDINTEGATGKLLTRILASINEWTAEIAREHSIEGVRLARAAGKQIGRPRYGEAGKLDKRGEVIPKRDGEDIATIVRAYREGGETIFGATHWLNEHKVPTRFGKGLWRTSTVAKILRGDPAAGRPGAIPGLTFSERGHRVANRRSLSGLLECHCRTILTGAGAKGYYYCAAGSLDPNHGRPYNIAESKLLPWLQSLIVDSRVNHEAKFGTRPAAVAASAEQLAALDAERDRVLDMYQSGDIDKAEKGRRITAVEAKRSALSATSSWLGLGPIIDWNGTAVAINAALRRLLKRIELDEDLLPIRAIWHPTMEYGESGPLFEPTDDATLAALQAEADRR